MSSWIDRHKSNQCCLKVLKRLLFFMYCVLLAILSMTTLRLLPSNRHMFSCQHAICDILQSSNKFKQSLQVFFFFLMWGEPSWLVNWQTVNISESAVWICKKSDHIAIICTCTFPYRSGNLLLHAVYLHCSVQKTLFFKVDFFSLTFYVLQII